MLAQGIWNGLLEGLGPYPDWVQVEVTSHTVGGGVYPMAAGYGAEWIRRHMPLELFARLGPVMRKAKSVHLQGWGEPLLHPEFPLMVRFARNQGVRVSTATSGAGANEDLLARVVDEGIDLVTVSLAGLEDATSLSRRGVGFETACATVETLVRLRDGPGRGKPQVYLLYTLLRGAEEELDVLPRLLGQLGVDAGVVSTLAFTTRQEHQEASLVPEDQAAYDAHHARMVRVRDRAAAFGVPLYYYVVHGGAAGNHCMERPGSALVVGSDGEVSPCIFTRLPVPGPVRYWFQGQALEFTPVSFGNVGELPMGRIWYTPAYLRFRAAHALRRLPWPCSRCWRPYMLAF